MAGAFFENDTFLLVVLFSYLFISYCFASFYYKVVLFA